MNKCLKILFKTNIYPYRHKLQRAKSKILLKICLERSLMELKTKIEGRAKKTLKKEKLKQMQNKLKTAFQLNNKTTTQVNICDPELKSFILSEINNARNIPKRDRHEKDPNFFPQLTGILDIDTPTDIIKRNEKERLKITYYYQTIQKTTTRNIFGRIENYLTSISNFRYFWLKDPRNILTIDSISIQIIDKHCLDEEAIKRKFRSNIKSWSYVSLFLLSWMLLFIMITDVYNKYESNMYDISISPLISVLIVKFLVTQNILIFIHTFIMYFFGEKYYNDNRKKLSPLHMIFRYVIPPIAKANHKAILAFQKFSKALEDRKG